MDVAEKVVELSAVSFILPYQPFSFANSIKNPEGVNHSKVFFWCKTNLDVTRRQLIKRSIVRFSIPLIY